LLSHHKNIILGEKYALGIYIRVYILKIIVENEKKIMSLNLGIFNYYSFIVECEYLEKTA
jgi:hypothetical protein